MTDEGRLRHSVLFTPGMRGDRIQKAIQARTADVVVADLEDSVAPADKQTARQIVCDAMAATANQTGVERWIRINTWHSGLARADLEAIVASGPDAIVVPKVEGRVALEVIGVLLDRLEARSGIAHGRTRLVPIVESARGVGEVRRILAASPRITAVAFGAEDLAADAGLRRTKNNQEVLAARSLVALAAAETGVDAIDQVFVDLEDLEGIEREAHEARNLGYHGKMVLHPRQVSPVHAAFAPAGPEVDRARRMVAAAEAGDAGEGGVFVFEGAMVDVPLIQQARRLLGQAEAAAKRSR